MPPAQDVNIRQSTGHFNLPVPNTGITLTEGQKTRLGIDPFESSLCQALDDKAVVFVIDVSGKEYTTECHVTQLPLSNTNSTD